MEFGCYPKEKHFPNNLIFCHNSSHYYVLMFIPNIINDGRECFDITLWFSSLDNMEIKKFLDSFEWLKNEKFVFIWGKEQHKHNMVYNSSIPTYYNVGEVLHIYKNLLKDVVIQYGDIYKKLDVLFIDEAQYH